MGVMLS